MTIPIGVKNLENVSILSTARAIRPDEITDAVKFLNENGLGVMHSHNLHAKYHQFAGTDEQRLADLQEMLDCDDVKAIWCARGGYGTTRIIDKINWRKFRENPKWIMGYSDITALHNHINKNFGIATLHATMPVNVPKNTPEALLSLLYVLRGGFPKYRVATHALNRKGKTEGILLGGNLSMLYSLCGSPSALDTKGAILFLEDLDEYLYHIDRMMLNLKRNGYLNNLAGLVIGGMTDMRDNAIPFGKTAEEIIAEHVAEFDYPICFGFPSGHLDDNRALIMGGNTILEVTEHGVYFSQAG